MTLFVAAVVDVVAVVTYVVVGSLFDDINHFL
jgi:hypothetical protein